MAALDKVLEVKDLRISFKTNGGTVKAVRGISFSLYRGRTLAIVGESGSGKSVTSKAILGILANNKIVEGGQIIYDGKDLLQISEDAFSRIRGVKISMIFQDPLSSLNPIMIVGKQLTEAMILKNKASRKQAARDLKTIALNLAEVDRIKAEELAKAAEENREDLPELLEANKELFKQGLIKSKERQKAAIVAALEALEAYGNFVKTTDFVPSEVLKEGKGVFKLVAACQLDVSIDVDDAIATFPIVLRDIASKEKIGIKLRAKREKEFEKYGAKTLYDLPPEVRAKESEVIVTTEESKKAYIDSIEFMIDYLQKIAERIGNATEEEIEAAVESEIKDFANAAKERNVIVTKLDAKKRAIELLKEVGIDEPERRFKQYPFELSGGMRQRIVIAIALASSPEVLICDEPTTALDVTIQAQILELINKLKAERNLSIVFITHDLGVVANMADDIAVMYAGKIVEQGTAQEIFYDPRHPYTWALLGSMPDLETKEKLHAIPGTPPNMLLPPKGDAFAARNEYALKIDELKEPPFFEVSPTHWAATWMLHEDAPDVEVPSIVLERIRKALKDHPEAAPKPTNKKNSVLNYISEVK